MMKVGLQLYSIRSEMSKNVPETLGKVKKMGYDYIELAGGRYDLSAKEMRRAILDAGLSCISVHSSPALFKQDRFDVLSYLLEIGAPYTAIPCPTGQLKAYTESWDETLSLFREMGEFFRKNGIRLLYHNHDWDFKERDGKVILDTVLDTLKDVLAPEPDLAWISYAGVKPSDFLSRYQQRVPVVHLKDYVCTNLPKDPIWKQIEDGLSKPEKKSLAGFDYAPLGQGVELWEEAISACEKAGTEYLIVEQDDSPDPMKAAEESRIYLKETFNL